MELIKMNSTYEDLGEELLAALMVSLEEQGNVIAFGEKGDPNSFCMICFANFFRFSIGNIQLAPWHEAMVIMIDFFGNPRHTFVQESSIDKGNYIQYMEWDISVLNGFRSIIDSDVPENVSFH